MLVGRYCYASSEELSISLTSILVVVHDAGSVPSCGLLVAVTSCCVAGSQYIEVVVTHCLIAAGGLYASE